MDRWTNRMDVPGTKDAPSFRAMVEATGGGGGGGGFGGGGGGGFKGFGGGVKGNNTRPQSARPLRGAAAVSTSAANVPHSRRTATALVSSHLINRSRDSSGAAGGGGAHGGGVVRTMPLPGTGGGKIGGGGAAGGRPGVFREKLREAPGSSRGSAGSRQTTVRGASARAALRRNVGDAGDAEDGPYADDGAQFVVPQFHSKKGFNVGVGWL